MVPAYDTLSGFCLKEMIGMGYIRLRSDNKPSDRWNHVHEVRGYVKMGKDNHHHHFDFITGRAIPINDKEHVHEIYYRTDLEDGHYHEFSGKTLGAVEIGDRHIHYIEDSTTKNAGHSHDFLLVTYIDNPTKN